jgi:ribosomal protein S18 acetylase RimI-like enzyme
MHQRRGLATAVIAPAVRLADAEHIGCYLETSTDSNRRFYERRGFVVERELTVTGAPQIWWMRRGLQVACEST